MFVLTETYKALQNNDNVFVGQIIPCIIATACLVLLVWVAIEGRKK